MLPFFAGKIFSISFFISLDFYLQVFSIVFLAGSRRRLAASPSATNILYPEIAKSPTIFRQ